MFGEHTGREDLMVECVVECTLLVEEGAAWDLGFGERGRVLI